VADVTSETTSQEKNWFADVNWRTNAIFLFISIFGGFSGATIAPKTTAQGMTQDAADVRYITKEEGNRRADARDKQISDIQREMVRTAIFDERTNMILKQLENMRQEQKEDRAAMERMLINR